MSTALLFKVIPYLVYSISVVLALTSSYLVYSGLSSQTERLQTRLRIKQSYQRNKLVLSESATRSNAESWLKKAGYPFGITAFKYHVGFTVFIGFLLVNYFFVPIFATGDFSIVAVIGIVAAFVLLMPSFPFSLFVYVMKRVIDVREAKKSAEVFMLYDLLINEMEMMTNSRINTYSLLRNIQPYFVVIGGSFAKLLTNWSNDEGPAVALDKFAEDIGTKEAKSLASVMKTLDDVEIETALSSLKGMNNMFVRSQIEGYRRKRKVTTDLSSMPIKTTHFLLILNFLIVIVMMVSTLMDSNTL